MPPLGQKKRVELSWEQQEAIVEWFRDNEILYNITADGYHHKSKKEGLWEDKADELGIDVDRLKGFIRDLRTQFTKILKSMKGGRKPIPLTSRKRWIMLNLEFLRGHIVHRKARRRSNLTMRHRTKAEDEDEDDEEDEDMEVYEDEEPEGDGNNLSPQAEYSLWEEEEEAKFSPEVLYEPGPVDIQLSGSSRGASWDPQGARRNPRRPLNKRNAGRTDNNIAEEYENELYTGPPAVVHSSPPPSNSLPIQPAQATVMPTQPPPDQVRSFVELLASTMREVPKKKRWRLQSRIMTMVYTALDEPPSPPPLAPPAPPAALPPLAQTSRDQPIPSTEILNQPPAVPCAVLSASSVERPTSVSQEQPLVQTTTTTNAVA